MSNSLTASSELEARIGENFRLVRRSRKVWLTTLAEALGVSVNTIRWHEAGVRSMRSDLIVRAAEVIGVPAAELLQSTETTEGASVEG